MDFKVAAVLPAGGTGERMGLPTPKQYCKLLNRPLISYTIEAFERVSWIDDVVVTVSPDRLDYMNRMLEEYGHHKTLVTLGATARHRSIYLGIKHLNTCDRVPDVVVIHDAVRPFVEEPILKEVASAAYEYGAAGAIRPLVSTVIGTDMDGFLDHSLERIKYRASEMPQSFQYSLIKAAYGKCTDYDLDYGTECLHLAQKYMKSKVRLIEGPVNLWKVTHKKDLYAAEAILKEELNKEVSAFGNCTPDDKENIQKTFAKLDIQVNFHDRFIEAFQDQKTKNLIAFTNEHNFEHLKSFLCKMKQISNKEKCSGGTIVCVTESQNDRGVRDLEELVAENSGALKKQGICLNAIIRKNKENNDWYEMACDLIYNRNLLYSGQTFFIL